jgi:cyclophilin family peptidyl-prolyl cis-trans isomerase
MSIAKPFLALTVAAILASGPALGREPGRLQSSPHDAASIIAVAPPGDWRPVDPAHTLYLELPTGRVVIELNPTFTPKHVANIETLVREGFFDGLPVERAQDNYVVQWGDPDGKKPLGSAQAKVDPEFTRPIGKGLAFTRLADPDTYAPQTGFSDGFPAARDPARNEAWLVHCYGMVGVARDNDRTTGSGSELYAVNGQAPRHLDRNVAVVGRVLKGMELLSVMPRGTAALGFYDKPEQRTPVPRVRMASDTPVAERTNLEVMRTDSASFRALIEARRNRSEPWFHYQADRVDVCNVPIPVRAAK